MWSIVSSNVVKQTCRSSSRNLQYVRPLLTVARSLPAQRKQERNLTPLRSWQYTARSYSSGPVGGTPTSGVVPFRLTDIGEGIAEVEVIKWHVKVGDVIKQFDLICEVQSDKATVEITSRYDGVVTKVHQVQGGMVNVGEPLVDIDLGSGEAAGSDAVAVEASDAPTHPTGIDALASSAIGADGASPIVKPDTIDVTVDSSSDAAAPKKDRVVQTTPAVRHMAKEANISLQEVIGTGRDGRITKEDVQKYLKNRSSSATAAKSTANATPTPAATVRSGADSIETPPTSAPSSSSQSAATSGASDRKPAEDRVVPITGYGKGMVKSMTAAAQVPHFGYSDEIVVDELMRVRKECKTIADELGVKLTLMPFFIKAASTALKKFPVLNSTFDATKLVMTYKGSHNIGVAMDSPNGLIVPNIKNVQDLTVFEIAQELARLQKAAMAGSVKQPDLVGGTFTLSNIGSIGGTYASPVVVLPEVAIGAIGKIQKLPRFDKHDNVKAVNVMTISWSADHRVIDGATMARYSNQWKQYLENPSVLLLFTK